MKKEIIFMDANMSDENVPEHTKRLMRAITGIMSTIPYELSLPAMFGVINELVYHVDEKDVEQTIKSFKGMIRDAIGAHLLMIDNVKGGMQ